ncbi:unknown [Firmicutes bacterium CAG:170]|nr:unknown [Firmicutes bacterium CAG:170]
MLLCSSMTFFVPSSAACVMGIGSSNHGVVTMRGAPSSSAPIAPSTMYPTVSMSRTESRLLPSGLISTASSGTNFGSEVMMVFPEPLCGSSSFARSRR